MAKSLVELAIGKSLFSFVVMAIIAVLTALMIRVVVVALASTSKKQVTATPVVVSVTPARDESAAVAAAIAAAVYAMLGAHRLVYIGEARSGAGWNVRNQNTAAHVAHAALGTPLTPAFSRNRPMMKHLRITVDGKAYDVVVEDMTEETGGSFYPAPGTMAAAQSASAPRAAAAPAAPAPSAVPAPGGENDKLAPLGGVIVEINVKAGDAVKAGDKVMTIEAMKMKTAVSAHRDGIVKAIPVKVGDAVDAGQVLLTID